MTVETAEQWSARWQKAKEEMANLPAAPVAWRSRHKDDPKDYWSYHGYPLGQDDCEQQQALYAAPPPAGADAVREALEPFAAVAEYDIGETEADADIYRPMSKNNRAPLLTIGDLRRACAALLPDPQK